MSKNNDGLGTFGKVITWLVVMALWALPCTSLHGSRA